MSTSNQHVADNQEDETSLSSSAVGSAAASSDGGQGRKKRQHGRMAGEDLELNCKETTVSGQMEINPDFTVDQAREAAKKEYNRRNSARSRVRSKKMVSHLQAECARLSQRERELMRENETLRRQLEQYKRTEFASSGQASLYHQHSHLPRASSAPAAADMNTFLSAGGVMGAAASLANSVGQFPMQAAMGAFPPSGCPTPFPQSSAMFLQQQLQRQGLAGSSMMNNQLVSDNRTTGIVMPQQGRASGNNNYLPHDFVSAALRQPEHAGAINSEEGKGESTGKARKPRKMSKKEKN